VYAIASHFQLGRERKSQLVYVCICNALTHGQLEHATASGATRPSEVYAACGCRAQCGTCVKTILCLIRSGVAGGMGPDLELQEAT
jgi:bacterioferritin-associated ferredoxin